MILGVQPLLYYSFTLLVALRLREGNHFMAFEGHFSQHSRQLVHPLNEAPSLLRSMPSGQIFLQT
jgi:hypothetical protein